MIDFTFTPQQELWQRSARGFLDAEIRPMIEPGFYEGHDFPWEAVRKMAKQGLLGSSIPVEYGGCGLGEVGYGIALEEVARIDAGLSTIVGAHTGICAIPTYLFGSEEQREHYLPKLCKGEWIGAFALTEPQAGSDAANIKTSARREGDEYVLNGTKIFVSNGDVAELLMVSAVTDAALGARGGVTAFLVEKSFPGVKVARVEDKMGIRHSTTAQIEFEDCRVPAENVLGRVGEGFVVALTALDGGRATLALGAVGGAMEALNLAIRYAREREVNGGTIGEHQEVMFRLAEISTDLTLVRYASYHCLQQVEQYYAMVARGESVPRPLREKVSRLSAQVKIAGSEASTRAVDAVVDVLGARGLVEGHIVEKGLRDAPIAEIYEGTNEIQRLVIGRELLSRGRFEW